MSALRVSVPGQPTVLVDLGPAAARASFTGRTFEYGSLVVAPSRKPAKWDPEKQRATNRRYYEKHRERLLREQREQRARAGW